MLSPTPTALSSSKSHRAAGAAALLCVLMLGASVVETEAQNMPGGVSGAVAPSTHEQYEEAANAAVAHLNARSNALPAYTLGRVVEVKKQVVAGTMLYITYEAVRAGVPSTELCVAKVWHKLDRSYDVMANTCKFTVEAVDPPPPVTETEGDKGGDGEEGDGAGAGGAGGAEGKLLMGGYKPLDHHSQEARSAAVQYARLALGLGMGGTHHGGTAAGGAGAGAGAGAGHHVLADGPGQERVYLCKAESQLVNGVNYRLTLGLDPARPAQCHTTAVVYKSFQGVYQVPPADETPTEGV